MAANKSSNVVCFRGERTKEDPLSTEKQREWEHKMSPSMLPTFSIDFAAQDLKMVVHYWAVEHTAGSLSLNTASLLSDPFYVCLQTQSDYTIIML